VRVMHERVAGIDVHKDMIKVAIRSPGEKRWTRKTEIFEFRTFYGVLQAMARDLRARGVTHVVMEASGVYTEPVYYALCEQDFDEVAVVNPAHVKALRGHKTDAADCRRLAELFECGLLHGSYIPPAQLKEVRDLTRYRMKTVQARTSEIQRLGKALESAGIKLGSVASEITGASATAMIDALIDGERRGPVLADLAIGRMRTAGKIADLSMALAGRFTDHHAALCQLHLDRIALFDAAVGGLEAKIAAGAAPYQRELDLRRLLLRFRLLRFDAAADFDAAARIYRRCRGAGFTPRGMVDCMIAAVAWRHGAALLAQDVDLQHLGLVIGIELDRVSPTR